ncbi:MAG TPA: phage tail protein [Dehalococcoidia bacterium]|jgi:hypothetical protein|nr:phage tail protein [Dehalococcoidia bacterium]
MGGKGGGREVTVGYRYSIGMQMALCHGPIDQITEIRVGDRTAWTGTSSGGAISISEPELFGGEDREGGVEGTVDVEMGGAAQATNSYLVAQLGDVPAFRGILALVLRQPYLGTVPRFKPWSVTGRRTPGGWPGAGSALIGEDANPAHIIYELITHQTWGMGYGDTRIDIGSFDAAATTLAAEGFGLSFEWRDAQQDVGDFLLTVLRHIDASAYVDPETGRWRLALARDDYDPETLDVLDESNVVQVVDYKRPGWGELVNEVTVTWVDGEGGFPTWKDRSITIQNLAVLQEQGGQVINETIHYAGVTKASLATTLAARDLRQLSTPLARLQLVLTADQKVLRPGDVRKFTWPDYGVSELIVRIVEVDYGTIADGKVTVTAVEDAFAVVAPEFAAPTSTEWVEPLNAPAAAPHRKLVEATYLHVAVELADSESLLAEIEDTAGFLLTSAVRPSSDAFNYEVWVDAGGGFQIDGGLGDFSPSTTLDDDIAPQQTVLPIDNSTAAQDLDLVETGTLAYLGDEILHVTDIDISAGTVTVDRAVIDTVPTEHASGARIFFAQNFESVSATEYNETEAVDVRLLPSTALGRLLLSSAPTDQIVFDARFVRPYPPGRIRVNTEDWPVEVAGVPTLEWAGRDRTLQTGPIITQDAGPIGPEPGTKYTVRVRDGVTDALRRTVNDIDAEVYVYDEAQELADGDALGFITSEIESVRDGHISWQFQRREGVRLAGYGRHYGNDYGGL